MGVASQLVTLAEYLRMECPEGSKDELIKGEVVISPAAKPNHALLMKRLVRLLDAVVDQNKFEVNSAMSMVVDASDPASMPQPDVFVMDRPRFRKAAAEDRYPEGSPELAIEVVSPSNTKKKLADKIDLYLAHGTLAVWIVYTDTRTAKVWKQGGKTFEYREGDALPLPARLSKRALQASDIFSVLD